MSSKLFSRKYKVNIKRCLQILKFQMSNFSLYKNSQISTSFVFLQGQLLRYRTSKSCISWCYTTCISCISCICCIYFTSTWTRDRFLYPYVHLLLYSWSNLEWYINKVHHIFYNLYILQILRMYIWMYLSERCYLSVIDIPGSKCRQVMQVKIKFCFS